MVDFVDCCNKCGEKKYAKYKPFRNLGAITMALVPCKLCKGANMQNKAPVIYAVDWKTMCKVIDYFD